VLGSPESTESGSEPHVTWASVSPPAGLWAPGSSWAGGVGLDHAMVLAAGAARLPLVPFLGDRSMCFGLGSGCPF
jgi:hypothetical protein